MSLHEMAYELQSPLGAVQDQIAVLSKAEMVFYIYEHRRDDVRECFYNMSGPRSVPIGVRFEKELTELAEEIELEDD